MVVTTSAWADGSLQKLDAAGKPDGAAFAMDDVRCRYDGKKLALITGGESRVQFLASIDDFQILPATRAWKGVKFGATTEAFFQDSNGKRYRASDKTRCDITIDREDTTTKLDVTCTALAEADQNLPEEKTVQATKLVCPKTTLVAR